MMCCAFSPCGTLIAAGGTDCACYLWRWEVSEQPPHPPHHHHQQQQRRGGEGPSDAARAAAAGGGFGQEAETSASVEAAAAAAVVSPPPTSAAASAVPWLAPEPLVRLIGHKNDVTQAKWSYAGRAIATASRDGTVRIWRAAAPRSHVRRRTATSAAAAAADPAQQLGHHQRWGEAAVLQCPPIETAEGPGAQHAQQQQRRRRPPPPLEINQVAWTMDDQTVSRVGLPNV
jgi:hypothetical protein